MCKRISIVLVSMIIIFGISELSFAMMCGGHSQHQQTAQVESGEHKHEEHQATIETSKEAVNVGNKICPVSGEKIDEKMKATYEYEGKIYNFCCEMCVEEFKKDPQKYIDKVKQELEAESKETSKHEEHEMGTTQGSEMMHQGHHH